MRKLLVFLRRKITGEKIAQPDPLDECVDDGQGADSLGIQLKGITFHAPLPKST
jgi:hypothetical protein